MTVPICVNFMHVERMERNLLGELGVAYVASRNDITHKAYIPVGSKIVLYRHNVLGTV